MAFFVVGLGEELLKYLVVILYAFRKPSFNEPFDGIVYAVMVSLGFAALENIFAGRRRDGSGHYENVHRRSDACCLCRGDGVLCWSVKILLWFKED